ncbi:MAG: TIGR03808 family TAT-translocated repetitive protein [Xanthobacteraceae bacterium]
MNRDRRSFLAMTAMSGVAAAALPAKARAAPVPSTAMSQLGLDAAHFGARPGSPDDQSRVLQRAIDEAARLRAPLALAPGTYRVGDLKLPTGAQLVGVRGATRLMLSDGISLLTASGVEQISLSGLVLDGVRKRLPERRGLVQLEHCNGVTLNRCDISGAGGNAVVGIAIQGELSELNISQTAEAAIHVLDARALLLARNSISGAGNNGIQVWRSVAEDDGTFVIDNRIENIENRSGGSGQYGNAVNVFRGANVMVRGNRIRNCAFSAIRGNAASNFHVESNSISDVREVAIYAEFAFQGALIANNSIDGAAFGVSVTNFNEGGRLAVVQGNLIRNLSVKRPAGTDPGDGAGIGIAVEADASVTGNVIEGAPSAGIMLGFGHYLRDVAATGNVVRKADIGIAVSVAPGAGTALIANNVIAEARRGAIVGMAKSTPVTGDLAKAGSEQYANLTLLGNRVR